MLDALKKIENIIILTIKLSRDLINVILKYEQSIQHSPKFESRIKKYIFLNH